MNEERMTEEMAYNLATFVTWWNQKGSGITPNKGDDMHEHAERVALVAWTAAMNRMRRDQQARIEGTVAGNMDGVIL